VVVGRGQHGPCRSCGKVFRRDLLRGQPPHLYCSNCLNAARQAFNDSAAGHILRAGLGCFCLFFIVCSIVHFIGWLYRIFLIGQ
jgi:hypothetical protein